jgi:L-fucose isomerase-like protein
MEVRLGVASSPHVGEDVRRHYGEVYGEMLRELGVSLAESSDVAVVVVLTGGAEEEVLSQAASYNVLLAWPHYNSLPSALEAAAALREGGRYAKVLELPAPLASPGEPLLKALRLISLMKTGMPKFGVVGMPNRWLVASGLAGAAAEETPLEKTLEGLNPGDGMEEARRIVEGAEASDFSAADLAPIVAYARRLEELAESRGWAGLTLGCWCFDLEAVRKMGWTPCISLTLLNQRGLPAACEGDLRALFSMYVLSRLSGKPAWLSNVNVARGDLLVLTHDGAPLVMTPRYSVARRMLTGAPAAIKTRIPPGSPATLLRVSGDLRRAILLRAVTVEPEEVEACNAQAGFKLINGTASDVLSAGLGNHLAYVLDDVYDEAKEYLLHLGAKVIP